MFIRILCPIHFSIFSPALKNEDSADDILIFSSYNPTIALDVIRNEEGCELKAYRCSAGVWTIGYGHTAGVTEGMAISQAHAEELLRADVIDCAGRMASYIKAPVTKWQFPFTKPTVPKWSACWANPWRAAVSAPTCK